MALLVCPLVKEFTFWEQEPLDKQNLRVAGIGSTTDAPSGQLRAVVVGEVCSYCHPLDPEPTQTYCKYRSDNDA